MRSWLLTISNLASSTPLPVKVTVRTPSSASTPVTVAATALVEFSTIDVNEATVTVGASFAPVIVKLRFCAVVVLVPSVT